MDNFPSHAPIHEINFTLHAASVDDDSSSPPSSSSRSIASTSSMGGRDRGSIWSVASFRPRNQTHSEVACLAKNCSDDPVIAGGGHVFGAGTPTPTTYASVER